MKYITEAFNVGKLSRDIRLAEDKSGKAVRLVMSGETKQLLASQTEYQYFLAVNAGRSRFQASNVFCGCPIDINHSLPQGEVRITVEVDV